jgi:hypothetical protein
VWGAGGLQECSEGFELRCGQMAELAVVAVAKRAGDALEQ